MRIRLPFKKSRRRPIVGSETHRPTAAAVLDRVQRLEDRALLSADLNFAVLPDVTVLGGAPSIVGIDGADPSGDTLTYSVTSSDPLVSAELFTGNRSMRVSVAGFGDMVFELFESRVPRATSRFIELAEADFFDGRKEAEVDDLNR